MKIPASNNAFFFFANICSRFFMISLDDETRSIAILHLLHMIILHRCDCCNYSSTNRTKKIERQRECRNLKYFLSVMSPISPPDIWEAGLQGITLDIASLSITWVLVSVSRFSGTYPRGSFLGGHRPSNVWRSLCLNLSLSTSLLLMESRYYFLCYWE